MTCDVLAMYLTHCKTRRLSLSTRHSFLTFVSSKPLLVLHHLVLIFCYPLLVVSHLIFSTDAFLSSSSVCVSELLV